MKLKKNLEKERSSLKDDITKLNSDLFDMEKSKAKLDKELVINNEKFLSIFETKKLRTNELHSINTKLNEAITEKRNLELRIQETNLLLQSLKSSNQSRQNEKEVNLKNIEKLQNNYDLTHLEVFNIKKEYDELKQNYIQSIESVKDLNNKLSQKKMDYDFSQSKIHELKNLESNLIEEINILQIKYSEAIKEIETLTKQKNELNQQLESQKRTINEYDSKNGVLNNEVQDLEKETKSLELEATEVNKKIKNQQELLESLISKKNMECICCNELISLIESLQKKRN